MAFSMCVRALKRKLRYCVQVHWPSIAGCPNVGVTGRVQAIGGSTVAPASLGAVLLRWVLRGLVLAVAVLGYRDVCRDPLLGVLPPTARRFLRGGGGDGSPLGACETVGSGENVGSVAGSGTMSTPSPIPYRSRACDTEGTFTCRSIPQSCNKKTRTIVTVL